MMQESSVFSLWPSFNSYSNTGLAEIAARVVEEFGSAEFYDEFYFEREENPAAEEGENPEYVERERGNSVVQEEDDDEEEFEFAVVNRETEFSSPISADEIFHNGQIRPVYPVFDRDLFPKSMELQQAINGKEEKKVRNSGTSKGPTNRLPLRMLFIQERQTTMTMRRTSSSSSSEAEELDGVPADSYCVWRPHEAAGAEKRCKKAALPVLVPRDGSLETCCIGAQATEARAIPSFWVSPTAGGENSKKKRSAAERWKSQAAASDARCITVEEKRRFCLPRQKGYSVTFRQCRWTAYKLVC